MEEKNDLCKLLNKIRALAYIKKKRNKIYGAVELIRICIRAENCAIYLFSGY